MYVKSAGLTTSVAPIQNNFQLLLSPAGELSKGVVDEIYVCFMSTGFVSMDNGKTKPIKILRFRCSLELHFAACTSYYKEFRYR